MNSRLVLMLILISMIVLFIIQNVVMVEIRFLFWSFEMSRSLLMFLLLAIGVIIGWFLHGFIVQKKSRS